MAGEPGRGPASHTFRSSPASRKKTPSSNGAAAARALQHELPPLHKEGRRPAGAVTRRRRGDRGVLDARDNLAHVPPPPSNGKAPRRRRDGVLTAAPGTAPQKDRRRGAIVPELRPRSSSLCIGIVTTDLMPSLFFMVTCEPFCPRVSQPSRCKAPTAGALVRLNGKPAHAGMTSGRSGRSGARSTSRRQLLSQGPIPCVPGLLGPTWDPFFGPAIPEARRDGEKWLP